MTIILERTTFEQIEASDEPTAYYGAQTMWWSHRSSDTFRKKGEFVPCDPRGGVLYQAPLRAFVEAARANPIKYGKHGLKTFVAAHNDNCRLSLEDDRPTAFASWAEYEALVDAITVTIAEVTP